MSNADASSLGDYRQLKVMTAEELIAFTKQQGRLRNIKRIVQMDDVRYKILYQDVIERFAELVQLMPASQAHHHAVPGGLFVHTLEVMEYALSLRQQYKLPLLAAQEIQEAQRHVWTYAIFAAAILHDVGKRLTLGRFVWVDKEGYLEPFVSDISKLKGRLYQILFHETKYHQLHEQLGLAFAAYLFPTVGLDFLFSQLHIMQELMAYIHEDASHDGAIGRILRAADQSSTGQSLAHSDSRKFSGANLENIGERLMTQLRRLLAGNHFVINRSNGNVYTSEDKRYTYIMSKTLGDELRNTMAELGQTDIPGDNNRIFDILQEYGFAEANPDTGQVIHYIRRIWQDKIHVFSVIKFSSGKLFRVEPPDFAGGEIKEVPKPGSIQITEPLAPVPPRSQQTEPTAIPAEPSHAPKSALPSHDALPSTSKAPEKKPGRDTRGTPLSADIDVHDDPFGAAATGTPATGKTTAFPVPVNIREDAAQAASATPISNSLSEPNEDPFAETGMNTVSASATGDGTIVETAIIDDVPTHAADATHIPVPVMDSPLHATDIQSGGSWSDAVIDDVPVASASKPSIPSGTEESKVEKPAPAKKPKTDIVDGELFLAWCREKVKTRAIVINESNSMMNKIAYKNGYAIGVVSPRIFMEYGQEELGLPQEKATAEKIQRAIHQKKLHIPGHRGQLHKYRLKRSEDAPLNGYAQLYLYLFKPEIFMGDDEEVREILERVQVNTNLETA